MIEQFEVKKFGVVVSGKLDKYVDQLLDLKPGVVQIPFHIAFPSINACKQLKEKGIEIVGKIVPPLSGRLPKDYARDMLSKFKGLVQIWDYGGEPETRQDQPGCRYSGTPQDYVQNMHIFYKIGKWADPDNVIGGCGWITSTFNGYLGNEDRSDFFNECCSLGIAEFLDFISLNFYVYGYGGIENIQAGVGKIKEILAWHRIKKPVTVSEYGVPCSGDPTFLHIMQTPERQAKSLVEQNILFKSLGIDHAMWFSLQYGGWGLVDVHDVPRPAYRSFQVVQKMLKGSKFKKRMRALPNQSTKEREVADKILWFVFERERRDVHVIWTKEGLTLERKRFSEFMEVYDMFGNKLGLDTFEISEEPLYILTGKEQLNQENFLQT